MTTPTLIAIGLAIMATTSVGAAIAFGTLIKRLEEHARDIDVRLERLADLAEHSAILDTQRAQDLDALRLQGIWTTQHLHQWAAAEGHRDLTAGEPL